MQEARKYRPNDEVFVRDWTTFKKVWKNTSFIREWGQTNTDQSKKLIQQRLDELLQDELHQCYVFPDSLKLQYVEVLIELVISDKYMMHLDYEHEGLFLDKPKQLVIFKKRTSVSTYLAKYRLPDQYRKLFADVLEVWKLYLPLLAKRNLKISKESPKEEIQQASQEIKQFRDKELDPRLDKWRKLTIRILEDFKRQPKKDQIMFLGVNSILTSEIKALCNQFELYYGNRYEKISQYDEYRDMAVTKCDKSTSDFYQEQSQNVQSDQDYLPSTLILREETQIAIQSPPTVENIVFTAFNTNGAKCIIYLPTFSKITPVNSIQIRLIHPQQSEQQRKYLQKIQAKDGQLEYHALLPCFHTGISTYEFKTFNEAGQCKTPCIFRIWQDGIEQTRNNQGIMKINKENYTMCVLGENDEGLIPDSDSKSEKIIRTTNQTWHYLSFQCSQFSVSSHATICNKEGEVASWGKMHYYEQPQQNQGEQVQNDEDDELGLSKIKPDTFRIEHPSLISSIDHIRKVSCGQGYCLMSDSLGRAWSFGINCLGQLGLEHNDENANTSDPMIINFFKAESIFVTDVAASCFGASFAIDSKGQAYRWGTNQMEHSNKPVRDSFDNIINFEYPEIAAAQSVPLPIGKKLINQKIASIHPGFHCAFALTQTNKLYGWGRTKYLGLGKIQDAHFKDIQNLCNPILILDNVAKVSIGQKHCLALKTENSLVGWGETKYFNEMKIDQRVYEKPVAIKKEFKGTFVCGKNFTVFSNEQKNKIKVVGNSKIFKKREYTLPFPFIELKAGEGVLMIKGKSQMKPQKQKIDQKTDPNQTKTIIEEKA